jgi:hypothetical protein
MKRWLRRMTWLLATLLLMCIGLVLHTIYFRPLSLDWFDTKVFAALVRDQPERVSSLRILPPWADVFGDRLGDVSPPQGRARKR